MHVEFVTSLMIVWLQERGCLDPSCFFQVNGYHTCTSACAPLRPACRASREPPPSATVVAAGWACWHLKYGPRATGLLCQISRGMLYAANDFQTVGTGTREHLKSALRLPFLIVLTQSNHMNMIIIIMFGTYPGYALGWRGNCSCLHGRPVLVAVGQQFPLTSHKVLFQRCSANLSQKLSTRPPARKDSVK